MDYTRSVWSSIRAGQAGDHASALRLAPSSPTRRRMIFDRNSRTNALRFEGAPHASLHGGPATGSPVGLPVRVRNTRFTRRDVAAGRVVRAVVRRIASALPLIVYEMSVVDDAGNEVLSGELGNYTGET